MSTRVIKTLNQYRNDFESLVKLAEICGIHAGDGYLRNDGKRCELDISGNYEEKEYYNEHVIPLFNSFFGLNKVGRYFPSRRTYGFVIREKKVVEFMHSLGFPYGSKTYTVSVPDFIKKDKYLAASFLRGYLDSDGCICFAKKYGKYEEFKRTRETYPRILLSTVSFSLGEDVVNLLKFLELDFCSYIVKPRRKNFHQKYEIHINGVARLNKWLRVIGTCSSIKTSKLAIWHKFGFCPPYTSLEQRHKILKGELHPLDLSYGRVV